MKFSKYYNQCKIEKVCVACHKMSVSDTTYCYACLQIDSVSKKELKKSRKNANLCIQCGNCPPYVRSDGRKYVRCKACLDYQNTIKAAHSDRYARYAKAYRDDLKSKVFNAYGNKCSCCAESESEFLTVDHIDNNGAKHRREIGMGSAELYRWAIKHQYPSSLQLLCSNCHLSKSRSGLCVHRRGVK